MNWYKLGLVLASLMVIVGVVCEVRAVFFTGPGELRTALTLVGYVLMGVGMIGAVLESRDKRSLPA